MQPQLVHEVEAASARQQPEILEHCYRTWSFGTALAARDGTTLDHQSFYVAAMLHDLGLLQPRPNTDFTLAGAERAIACATAAGLTRDRAEAIADAICVHPTPGLSIRRDGALGFYLQAGAMADVSALRLWDIGDSDVQQVLRAHPRGVAFKPTIDRLMHAEAAAVPAGRFALLVRCGATLAIKGSIHGIR